MRPGRHRATGSRSVATARRSRAAQPGADAVDRLLRVLARAEGGEAEVALAGRPEAGARRAHDPRRGEHAVEEVPRRHAARGAEPDVGRVAAAVHLEAGGGEAVADDARVAHVEVDERADFLV